MTTSKLFAFVLAVAPAVALADPPPNAAPTARAAAPVAPAPATQAPIKPAPAAPASIKVPSFEVLDRGDAVEIIAYNIKAARTAIIPLRSRLQVPIVGTPTAKRAVPGDRTVKLIEFDSDNATRMLSVKLGFEYADVKALSRFAQAIQVGDDLHVLVPRKLPTSGVAPQLPEPTLPPDLAAAVARIDPPVIGPRPDPTVRAPEPIATPNVKPDVRTDAKPDVRTDAKPDAKPDARAAATTDGRDATAVAGRTDEKRPDRPGTAAKTDRDGKPLQQVLAPDADDSWSRISLYGALGLAAAGAGIWLMRRRRAQVAPPATIEIIAQRSLGGKARIVWLSAGTREMIVSVTAQQVRMLGQWRKADAIAALPAAQTHADARVEPRGDRSAIVEKPMSPAVSGLLRLRRNTQSQAVSETVATGDVVADELWAKEIVAATGARR